jgi:hypothetical protein
VPYHLDVTPVARRTLIGHDDAIMWLLFGANTAQSNSYHI